MSTFLFEKIIFGPVRSRRLGASLGINLLPGDRKVCTFDCIYCECGWTYTHSASKSLHSREEVRESLITRLIEMKTNQEPLDTITFAGNGEPTIHPDFDLILQDTMNLRDQYFADAKVAVLSNASMIHKTRIFNALKKADHNILKLDSMSNETARMINQPKGGNVDQQKLVEHLMKFNGSLIIQTMFIRASYNGTFLDNTTARELDAWLSALKKIKPQRVMIYTIARDTPMQRIERISYGELYQIAERVEKLNIPVQISD